MDPLVLLLGKQVFSGLQSGKVENFVQDPPTGVWYSDVGGKTFLRRSNVPPSLVLHSNLHIYLISSCTYVYHFPL